MNLNVNNNIITICMTDSSSALLSKILSFLTTDTNAHSAAELYGSSAEGAGVRGEGH